MISDLSKFLNKSLTLTLVNGIQKNGTLVSIDLDENTIRIKDEVGNPISVLISLIGMVEPYSVRNLTREVENKVIPVAEVNREEKQLKLNEIVSRYTTAESDSKLILRQPVLSVPFEINDLGRNSNEMKIWNLILNKFADGKKNKKLEAKSETLKSILKNLDELKTVPRLYKSPSLNELLAYFHFLNNDYEKAFHYCRRSVVFNNSRNNLYNMSIAANRLKKSEVEFISIDKFISQSDEWDNDIKSLWMRYVYLIKTLSAHTVAKNLIPQTTTYKKFGRHIIEGLAYLLSEDGKQNEALEILNYLEKGAEDYEFINSFRNLLVRKTSDKLILEINSFEEESRQIRNELINTPEKQPEFRNLKTPKFKTQDIFKEARYERDYNKNFEKAKVLFTKGIESEIDYSIKERAVRDLASMLAQQMSSPGEAIEVINKHQVTLSDADLNLLYNFYFQLEMFGESIAVMRKLLNNTVRRELKINRISLIAGAYLRMNKFAEATQSFKEALQLDPNNIALRRNVAISLIKQNKIADARKILEEIIDESSDSFSIKLLENLDIENSLPDQFMSFDVTGFLDRGLDQFSLYYLNNCELTYVDKSKLSIEGSYASSEDESIKDIKKLEDTATTLATKIAEGRSNIYFNAAKIVFDLGKIDVDLYKYLYRAFASKGDNSVQVRNHLDTVKTFYLTAMSVYDKIFLYDSNPRFKEQDAISSICRYFYSLIGRDSIPLSAKGISISDTVIDVFNIVDSKQKFFESILVAIKFSPQFAMNSLMQILYKEVMIRQELSTFLNISDKSSITDFSTSWKNKAKALIKTENEVLNKLAQLRPFQLTEIWLYSSVEKINEVLNKLFFELDRDYLQEISKICDVSISLSKAISFDDKISRSGEVRNLIFILRRNIGDNPTKFAIEELLPLLDAIDTSIVDYINSLYLISRPQLLFTSASTMYQVKENLLIDTQLKIENISEGHAEQVEIFIKDIEIEYTVLNTNINFGTIRGKSQKIEIVTLKLSQSVIDQKAFTLKILAKYKYIDNQIYTSEEQEVSIQIGNPEDFIPATNKFATYAESAEVKEKEMFYGRDNIITSIYESVCNHYKSFVFYGQKRAGKSSILYHAEQQLKNNSNILVANIGNIGSVIDSNSKVPLLYQILYDIINKIEYSVEDKISDGLPKLEFSFPDDLTFYNHPSPLQKFRNLMREFLRELSKFPEWSGMKIVVLIDEFTYIYHLIMQGKLSQDFMINWKAILQENFFSVVLVAQDFYPKFRAYDPNAFQTMQSERISYLREPDARKLIDEPIMINGESRYAEKAIDRIVELTAGSPFYIQIFCDELVDYVNEEKVIRITEANVNKVLREKLLNLDKSVFDNLINDGDSSSDAILESDAEIVLREIAKLTKNQPFCDSSYMNITTKSSLTDILQNLVQREVVEVNKDGYYKIKVDLFKEWLINNPI